MSGIQKKKIADFFLFRPFSCSDYSFGGFFRYHVDHCGVSCEEVKEADQHREQCGYRECSDLPESDEVYDQKYLESTCEQGCQ